MPPLTPRCFSAACREGRLFLRVDWTPEALESFDVGAWQHPKVDASASPAAIKPTLDLMKVGGEWRPGEEPEGAVGRRSRLPPCMRGGCLCLALGPSSSR